MKRSRNMFRKSASDAIEADLPRVTSAGTNRIVDVRERRACAEELAHIEGAARTPSSTLTEAARIRPHDAELVVGGRGGRSSRAAQALREIALERVVTMSSGTMTWNVARLPVALGVARSG